MSPGFKIGVDGGGTKTECILLDAAGEIVARHLAPASNPNVVGPESAREILIGALNSLRTHISEAGPPVLLTHLYMAGSRSFWLEVARSLVGFGEVSVFPDSWPVLELATQGRPGLVLHSGTGSFVAARAPDGTLHYAGGLGWRFGDPGSGYDLGRRAVARTLLELQGWALPSSLGPAVRAAAELPDTADAASVTRFFYQHPEANRKIAALAPVIMRCAAEGDPVARELTFDSTGELLTLAIRVAAKLFPPAAFDTLPAGLSGPILTQPIIRQALAARSPFPCVPVEGAPVDGIRRLLMRT